MFKFYNDDVVRWITVRNEYIDLKKNMLEGTRFGDVTIGFMIHMITELITGLQAILKASGILLKNKSECR